MVLESLPVGFSLEVEESDEGLRESKRLLLERLNLVPFASAEAVVNYLRVLYSTKMDLYFIEPSILAEGRYPEYDQPDNYRKALFKARELLAELRPEECANLLVNGGAPLEIPVSSVFIAVINETVDKYCRELTSFVAKIPRASEKTDTDIAISVCHKSQSVLGCGGLFASEALKKDTVIVRIEEPLIINVFAAIRDAEFSTLAKFLLDENHHVDSVLLLFLVDLRNRSQRQDKTLPELWQKFFDNLPCDFQTLMTWPEEAVEALGVDAVVVEVKLHKDMLIQTYTSFPENICQKFSLDDLLWAKCLCSSRSFMNGNVPPRNTYESEILDRIPSKRLTCVVPGLDLLNHSPHAQCRVPIFKDGALEIKIEAGVRENQEIFLNYGGITNWEFLFHQGFFFSGNVNDKIEIELEPETEDQAERFRSLGLPVNHVLRLGAPQISPKFFDAVEIITGSKNNSELVVDLLLSMRPRVALPEQAWWLDEFKVRIEDFRHTYNELIDSLIAKVKAHYQTVKPKLSLRRRR